MSHDKKTFQQLKNVPWVLAQRRRHEPERRTGLGIQATKAESRKPKAEVVQTKQEAGSRKPKDQNRKPQAEGQKPKAENRKPNTESRTPKQCVKYAPKQSYCVAL